MAECCWTDCPEEAVRDLQVDAGESTCETCGVTKTNKTVYPLCEIHFAQYTETYDNAHLMANSTPGGMS